MHRFQLFSTRGTWSPNGCSGTRTNVHQRKQPVPSAGLLIPASDDRKCKIFVQVLQLRFFCVFFPQIELRFGVWTTNMRIARPFRDNSWPHLSLHLFNSLLGGVKSTQRFCSQMHSVKFQCFWSVILSIETSLQPVKVGGFGIVTCPWVSWPNQKSSFPSQNRVLLTGRLLKPSPVLSTLSNTQKTRSS